MVLCACGSPTINRRGAKHIHEYITNKRANPQKYPSSRIRIVSFSLLWLMVRARQLFNWISRVHETGPVLYIFIGFKI